MGEDDRLTRIETKLDAEIQASATFRGRLEQYMKGQSEYTDAVSRKASDVSGSLEIHKTDKDAHGAGVRRELDGKIVGWAGVGATFLAAFGGIIGAVVHKIFTGEAPRHP